LVNILILRLCNYDKSPGHVESTGKFTLSHARTQWWSPCECDNAVIVSLEATMATPTANKMRKLQSYTLDFKLKILTEVDKKDRSKTDICKEYGLANSTCNFHQDS
jgi:hypothetical protein